MNSKVDQDFNKAEKRQKERTLLTKIILECQLYEEIKQSVPTYTNKSSNIGLIHAFKEYCAVLFFKGVLLKDPNGMLIQQTENVQSARQIRFTGIREISKLKSVIKDFIFEACEAEESGVKVKLKKTADYKLPEEFKHELN